MITVTVGGRGTDVRRPKKVRNVSPTSQGDAARHVGIHVNVIIVGNEASGWNLEEKTVNEDHRRDGDVGIFANQYKLSGFSAARHSPSEVGKSASLLNVKVGVMVEEATSGQPALRSLELHIWLRQVSKSGGLGDEVLVMASNVVQHFEQQKLQIEEENREHGVGPLQQVVWTCEKV